MLGSKVAILGMVIPPLIGILIMGIKTPTIGLMTIPYYGNNGSLDPSIYEHLPSLKLTART